MDKKNSTLTYDQKMAYKSQFLDYLRAVNDSMLVGRHYDLARPVVYRHEHDSWIDARENLALKDDAALATASRVLVRFYGLKPSDLRTVPDAIRGLKAAKQKVETVESDRFRTFTAAVHKLFGSTPNAFYAFEENQTIDEALQCLHRLLHEPADVISIPGISRLAFYREILNNHNAYDELPTLRDMELAYRAASEAAVNYFTRN